MEYVAFIDVAESRVPSDVFREALWRVADLYAAALRLPNVNADRRPDDEGFALPDAPSPDEMSTDEWMARWRRLGAHLGPEARYRELFDPYEAMDDEPVVGNLADDLLDIYRDLRRGLGYSHVGAAGDAVWDWQLNFAQHWGDHATSALRALHALATNTAVGLPSPPMSKREDG